MRLAWIVVLAACGGSATPGEPAPPEPAEGSAGPQRVQVSERVAKAAGIQVAAVELAALPATVELIGEVAADPDHVAKVPVRVGGRLVELTFHEGQRVAAGDVLATIESSEIARVRAELAASNTRADAARKRVDRLVKLVDAGTASPQDLETARSEARVLDAEVAAARQTLASIGGGGAAARMQIRAPISGVITQRDGVAGEPVGADHVVAEIVDLDRAIFLARLFEHDLSRVREGADAQVTLDAYPDLKFHGKVLSIARRVEPIARAVLARIVIEDRDGRLKIGLFGTVLVMDPDATTTPAMPVVPAAAVTQIEDRAVVFVETAAHEFEARPVELGHAAGGKVEIVKGLAAGDRVATGGLFTLKSLALKSTFGEED